MIYDIYTYIVAIVTYGYWCDFVYDVYLYVHVFDNYVVHLVIDVIWSMFDVILDYCSKKNLFDIFDYKGTSVTIRLYFMIQRIDKNYCWNLETKPNSYYSGHVETYRYASMYN